MTGSRCGMGLIAICFASGAALAQDDAAGGAPNGIAPAPATESGVIGFIDHFDDCLPTCGDCHGWGNLCGLLVTSPPAHSGTHSVRLNGLTLTDIVKPVGYRGGMFIMSTWSYAPSGIVGETYFIGFNAYDPVNQCAEAALQLKFDALFDTVSNDAGGFTIAPMLPLVRDEWVRYTAIIDLEQDRYWDYYGDMPLTSEYKGEPLGWDEGNAFMGSPCGPPQVSIAAVNLFSNGADHLFDDVSVLCYADMSTAGGIGTLDIFDFLAFQDRFVTGDITADCDISTGHGVLDMFDYMCFQQAFAAGCG